MMVNFPEKNNLERLEYLYAEIHDDEEVIPEDKIEFWKSGLELFTFEKKSVLFTIEEIQTSFTSMGIIPMSIIPVMKEFEKSHHTMTLEQLKAIEEGREGSSNEANALVSLVSSLWTLGSSLFQSSDNNEKALLKRGYVNIIIFQDIGHCISKYLSSSKNDSDEFRNGFVSIEDIGKFSLTLSNLIRKSVSFFFPNDEKWSSFLQQFLEGVELKYFILYFIKQHKIQKIDDKIISIRSFLPHKAQSSSSSHSASLTQNEKETSEDVALAKFRLQFSLYQLNEKIELMQNRIQDYHLQAVKAKKLGNDPQALLKLKLKKNVVETQKKLFVAQYNLEDALHTIESSHLNTTILNAYKLAASGLKVTREQQGLTVESVDDAMEEFQNEMDEMKLITDTMNEFQASQFTAEEEKALEDELEALMQETAVSSSLPHLPEVPSRPIPQESKHSDLQERKEALLS